MRIGPTAKRKRALLSLGSVLLPTLVLLVHGCRDATQVTLDVKTNVNCADMRGVEIVVATNAHAAEQRSALLTPGTRFPTATTTACQDGVPPHPVGTLVLTPSSGEGAVVVIAAFGKAKPSDCQAPNFAPECIVARRRFSFVDHTPISLPVVLDPSCAGVPCNENSTCVGKKCVDSRVECATGTCTDPGGPGLVEVDGASPLVDAPISSDGDANEPKDGEADARDSEVDSGNDDGGPRSGTCPTPNVCHDTNNTTCNMLVPMCCFNGNAASCVPFNTAACAKISACCRDANDCGPGDVCCASTASPMDGVTQMVCKKDSECPLQQIVCRTVGGGGCGTHGSCNALFYSSAPYPDFFRCS